LWQAQSSLRWNKSIRARAAALVCNYGRGFCLIDIGTEGEGQKFLAGLVADRGNGGGWSLMEAYKTNLTGLNRIHIDTAGWRNTST
jgi:hypothetical protein